MNAKTRLIIPALILAAAAVILLNRTMAQSFVVGGPWPRDLTLLDQPHTNQGPNGLGPAEVMLEVGTVTMDFSAAMLATNHPTLKFGRNGMTPVICQLHIPCRLALEPTAAKQTMRLHLSDGASTFTGGVKVEVFIQDQVAFDLTADEVTVER
jgi:hypothetical protein